MPLTFLWDARKAATNLRKHGISFEKAAAIFWDPLLITVPDRQHSDTEERWYSIGRDLQGQLIVVAHTESGDSIRIINARRPVAKERRIYEEGEEG